MLSDKKKYINCWILFFSTIFFLLRWYNPLINFDEQIDITIIFESTGDGFIWFAPFKAFANLDLSNSFDPIVKNLRNISVPSGSFYLHFILYSILGSWSFIIAEYFLILIFFIIFYKISRLLNFTRIESLLISIILFNVPFLLKLLSLSNLEYFNVIYSEFFSFRFPRPLVSNMFFYSFILYVFRILNKDFFIKKNFIVLGIISGLSFTSFFHVFVLEQLTLLFLFFYIFKNKAIEKLKSNFNYIILYILFFVIISAPFLLNMFFSEMDFLERMGLAELNYERKIFLLNYLFLKLFKFEFLFVLLLSVFFFLIINYKKSFVNLKKLNIFFIIFYISIFTPFIFTLISPKFFSRFYLFNNIILISAFLLFFYLIFSLLKFYLKEILSKKTLNIFSFFVIFTTLFLNFYQYEKHYNKIHLNNDEKDLAMLIMNDDHKKMLRKEFIKISNLIDENDNIELRNSSLLTFDDRFMIWAILNDIKYMKIVSGVITPKTNEMIEKDLIETFKFLDLNKDDFFSFIENRKLSSWRYRNESVKKLFWMRYQANSLITYNNSKDFDPKVLNFINNSSPLLSQQLAMPREEINRLLLKFDSLSSFDEVPDLIILNKSNEVINNSNIDLKIYCKKFDGKYYVYYHKLHLDSNCIN